MRTHTCLHAWSHSVATTWSFLGAHSPAAGAQDTFSHWLSLFVLAPGCNWVLGVLELDPSTHPQDLEIVCMGSSLGSRGEQWESNPPSFTWTQAHLLPFCQDLGHTPSFETKKKKSPHVSPVHALMGRTHCALPLIRQSLLTTIP